MDIIIIWIIVGMFAGVFAFLASAGSGYGIVTDILVGVAGTFVAGWIFDEAGWRAPLSGMIGVAVVAFLGAVVALFFLRVFKRLGLVSVR